MRRRPLLTTIFALSAPATLAVSRTGLANTWPARPVRLVVPFPPGGSPDLLARRLADRMAATVPHPVIVENRPGAGGTIGADIVAKSAPDGHVLGLSNLAPHAVGPAVYPTIPYDPLRDFTHIALLGEFPLVLAISADRPWRDLDAFLAAARTRPATLNVGTPGNGTAAQVSLHMLRTLTGAETVHVPFRGGTAAALETVAGRIDATVAGFGELSGNDRLRFLAMASTQRLPTRPEVPTFREQGVDLVATVWFGLCAPAGLAADLVDRLHAASEAAMSAPDAVALTARLGGVPRRSLTRTEMANFVRSEAERWGAAARAAGVRAE